MIPAYHHSQNLLFLFRQLRILFPKPRLTSPGITYSDHSSLGVIYFDHDHSIMDTNCPFAPCIATMSLGSPHHSLVQKLRLASRTGFQGIELYWDDLAAYASASFTESPPPSSSSSESPPPSSSSSEPPPPSSSSSQSPPPSSSDQDDHSSIEAAAKHISSLCAVLGLTVVSLQPFRNYDGLIDRAEHAARLDEFKFWMRIAAILRADTIGVPATIDPAGHDMHNRAAIVADMRELAELAGTQGMRVAYENLCFSAAVSKWEDGWDVVRAVDMPNLGFLPDTFNICGSGYADPAEEGGVIPSAEGEFCASMQRMRNDVDSEKVFLIQVADGERMAEPIGAEHAWMAAPGVLNPRMAWSRNARLFPFEKGGYLPVVQVLRALVGDGRRFRGARWISMEVFSRSTAELGDEVVERHVERAWRSWVRVKKEMGWQGRTAARSISMPALGGRSCTSSPAKGVV